MIRKCPRRCTGEYGLWALQDRFENAGGSLSSNRIGASWTVLASLPLERDRHTNN